MITPRARMLAGALGVSIVLLGVLGALGIARASQAKTQQRLIAHTYRVKSMLSALRSELDALEIEHVRRALARGTPGTESETPSVIQLGHLLRDLRDLTVDNPAEQVRVIRLGRLVRQRHAQLDAALNATAPDDTNRGLRLLSDTTLLDSIGDLTRTMRQEEDSLLTVRIARGSTSVDLALVTLVAITLTGCAVAGVGAASTMRENHRHRAALAALADSEARYRSLVGDVQDVIFQADADGHWVLLNAAWTTITGFTLDESIGHSCLEHVHPADCEAIARHLRSVGLGTEETFAQPIRILARDGGVRWLQLHSRAHRNPKGHLLSVVGTLSDITARVHVEDRQRRDDERMRQVIEDIPVAVAVFDRDMRYLFASRAWRAKYGFETQAIEGRPHYELVPGVPESTRAVHRRALAGEIVRNEQEHVLRADGSDDWFRWEVRPWHEHAGSVGGVIITTERITARKRAEHERLALVQEQAQRAMLAANEERYRTVAEALPQIVFTAQPDGSTDYFNDNWYAYTGLSREQSLGWSWLDALHPDDAQRSRRRFLHSCEHGSTYEIEYRFRRADDVYRWHLGRAVPIRDAAGRVVKWIGTCTDIDDQKRAENALHQVREQLEMLVTVRTKELSEAVKDLQTEIAQRTRIEDALRVAKDAAEAANRAKSDFLAHMSHELRTPLNSVIGFANLLLKRNRQSLGEQGSEYVGRIVTNGTHLLGLINDILDLSKIEAGHGTVALSQVDVGGLVDGVLAQLGGQTRGRDVRLEADRPPWLVPLETDEQRLRQVLINLVGNALKFTEHGSVTVRVHADAGTGRPERIDVVDTGIGIPADRQAQIFEAFEQAEAGTARRYGGTGLGLAISRALCQLMGHALTLTSAPGQGSTFSILLAGAATEGETCPALPARIN